MGRERIVLLNHIAGSLTVLRFTEGDGAGLESVRHFHEADVADTHLDFLGQIRLMAHAQNPLVTDGGFCASKCYTCRTMRSRAVLLGGVVLLGLTIAPTLALAVEESLFWRFWWFDIPMHFFGGMFTAFLMLWLAHGLYERGIVFAKYPFLRPSSMLLFAVFMTLLGAVSWEIFEVLAGNPRELNYQFDTTLDVYMGVIGSVATVLVVLASRTGRALLIRSRI